MNSNKRNMDVKLCIVIATKNRHALLSVLVTSLLQQLQDGDHIIVSDASEANLLSNFTLDNRVLIEHNNTQGVTQNRNVGLKHLEKVDYDFWTILDDDLEIPLDYISILKRLLSNLDVNTAITGSINYELLPKLPDWLGFYRKNALTKNGYLLMPHSVGVWIPKLTNTFKYNSEHFYGNDELELRNYLIFNKINLKYAPELVVLDKVKTISSGASLSSLERDLVRIYQNAKFRYLGNFRIFNQKMFMFRCLLHMAVKGEKESKHWARVLLINPYRVLKWLFLNKEIS